MSIIIMIRQIRLSLMKEIFYDELSSIDVIVNLGGLFIFFLFDWLVDLIFSRFRD